MDTLPEILTRSLPFGAILVAFVMAVRTRRLYREACERARENAAAAKRHADFIRKPHLPTLRCKCGEAFRPSAFFCHRCGGENNAACPPVRAGSILGRSPEGTIRGYKPGDVPLGIATHGTVRSNALLYTGVHPAYGWSSFSSVTTSHPAEERKAV